MPDLEEQLEAIGVDALHHPRDIRIVRRPGTHGSFSRHVALFVNATGMLLVNLAVMTFCFLL